MAYTYTTLTVALASAFATAPADSDFIADLPAIIDQAEQQCYRELGLLATVVQVQGALTADTRYYTLPTSAGHFLEVSQLNILDGSGNRTVPAAMARPALEAFYSKEAAAAASSMPQVFARVDDTTLMLGPPPGTSWTVEVAGTIRPEPLSSTNATTFLSQYLSDLFVSACMVAGTGILLRNWGAQADDPKQALSWKADYEERLASAKSEELRKRFASHVASAA